jgi:8-oxo-dGTP pyrophosphatase MutT (NUDIX family)
MQPYCLGFAFSANMAYVALIKKARPDWQARKLNGIGGHIEPGEAPLAAMHREMQEESGLVNLPWKPLAIVDGAPAFKLHVFSAVTDDVFSARSPTDEPVLLYETFYVLHRRVVMLANVPLLVSLALDDSGIVKPVAFVDTRPKG